MASIIEREKDGKTLYHVRIRLKGFPTQTANFHRVTDAKRWIQQTEAAIREGRYFKSAEAKKHTLADLIDRYFEEVLSHNPKLNLDYKSKLLYWKKVIGHHSLANITPALIVEYRNKLANPSCCSRTGVGGGLYGAYVASYQYGN